MKIRSRGEKVRNFILTHVEAHPGDIARRTAEQFGISRQAANKHLANLVNAKALLEQGNTRQRTYKLCPVAKSSKRYARRAGLAEDVVWRDDIAPQLAPLPENVMNIWHSGFTEMFNNAIDHSGGKSIVVHFAKTANAAQMWVIDDGIGIFTKIQDALGLLDERHAVLELAKGKLTTDPAHHSGEGIFFASRMFDRFAILSGGTHFSHEFGKNEDWITELSQPSRGTVVFMQLKNHTARTTTQVYKQFSSGPEEFAFTKTIVPVRLAQYGGEKLISRSQAKRLLARIDRFQAVIFDFDAVSSVGQAFADEIFRVFARQHPKMELVETKATPAVQEMINRARASNIG